MKFVIVKISDFKVELELLPDEEQNNNELRASMKMQNIHISRSQFEPTIRVGDVVEKTRFTFIVDRELTLKRQREI